MLVLFRSITKQEWKFWAKVLIALVFITSISRIFAIILSPNDWVWSGRTYFPPGDHYVYISYIEQIKNGANILHDLFSAKEDTAPMFNIFWMSLGYIARFTGFSALIVKEVSRILLIPGLLFLLYLLISYFFKNIFERKIAFLLSVFGGGIGIWVYPITNVLNRGEIIDRLPIDISVSEAFVFLSSYYSAHFIFSIMLFIFLILNILIAADKKRIKYVFFGGIAGAILLNFHPFSFVVFAYIFAVYFLYLLWVDRARAFFIFKYFLFFGLLIMPAAIYHVQMMSTPWWQNQAWASGTEAPNIIYIILGYGFLFLFSIASIYRIIKNNFEIERAPFLIIWFFGQISLIFLPISIQRRFLEGYSIILSILATPYIVFLIKKKPWLMKGKCFPATVFICTFCLSFLAVIYLDFTNYIKKIPQIYFPKDYYKAMLALRKYTNEGDLILADVLSSNAIPGVALRNVFVGHGAETINFQYKFEILTRFGEGTNLADRMAILKNNKIDYFFYDPNWNWAWNPDNEKFLQKIYEQGIYKIYKVVNL
ncbi:MAG: hypothetical protein WC459_01010 [Patescibacteria group bacterium]